MQTVQQIHDADISGQPYVNRNTRRSVKASCSCKSFTRTNYHMTLAMIHFQRIFRRQHYSTCPRYKTSDQSLEYTLKLVPPTWLLSRTVEFSLFLREAHDGRLCSFSPLIFGTSRLVDRDTSPGFRLVDRYRKKFKETEVVEVRGSMKIPNHLLESFGRSLKDLLDDGSCSVLDQDRDGRTLLYVCLRPCPLSLILAYPQQSLTCQ